MATEIETFLPVNNELGESVRWHPEEQALYWVDILGLTLHRYLMDPGKIEIVNVGTKIGSLAFREKGGLLLATKRGLGFWDWENQMLEIKANPEEGKAYMRFNDGAVDPAGRFWVGSMYDENPTPGSREGSLWRYDPDGSIHEMETGLAISNGLGWSPDRKTMYLTDSLRHVIYAYDYDLDSGAIENRRDFIHTPDEQGVPDGMAIDAEGFIWSARWGGGKITRYSPDGKIDREIKLPVSQPTCCAFGGKNLDDLYITSCWEHMTPEQKAAEAQAGNLLLYKAGIKGRPESKFKG